MYNQIAEARFNLHILEQNNLVEIKIKELKSKLKFFLSNLERAIEELNNEYPNITDILNLLKNSLKLDPFIKKKSFVEEMSKMTLSALQHSNEDSHEEYSQITQIIRSREEIDILKEKIIRLTKVLSSKDIQSKDDRIKKFFGDLSKIINELGEGGLSQINDNHSEGINLSNFNQIANFNQNESIKKNKDNIDQALKVIDTLNRAFDELLNLYIVNDEDDLLMARLALLMGARPNAEQLEHCALNGKLKLTKLLLEHQVPIPKYLESGKSLLMRIVEIGDKKIAEELLKCESIDVNQVIEDENKSWCASIMEFFKCKSKGARGETALHIAASKGNKDMIDLLIRYGADEDILDLKGNSYRDYLSPPIEVLPKKQLPISLDELNNHSASDSDKWQIHARRNPNMRSNFVPRITASKEILERG